MPRNISFALTTSQFLDGTKDVTRRLGWEFLKAGDVLMAVEKTRGIKKGELKRLGLIRIVSVRRERLDRMESGPYGRREVRREGFPNYSPREFILFFCKSHKGCMPENIVTRILFERIANR